ncbi:MAG TPA: cupin domain-containing protein [Stellaceae bacterium]|nr:cupin domain-containing protein [Stellaceae bacterium]
MTKKIVTANPAEVELDPAPFPREWVLEGTPQARAKEIARSGDGAMKLIVWSCTPGRFRWQYSIDESVQILSGVVVVTDHNGTERRLGPGDSAFFPAGTSSVWRVEKEVRKVAVCRTTIPKVVEFGLRAWHWGARRANALLSGNAPLDGFGGDRPALARSTGARAQ